MVVSNKWKWNKYIAPVSYENGIQFLAKESILLQFDKEKRVAIKEYKVCL